MPLYFIDLQQGLPSNHRAKTEAAHQSCFARNYYCLVRVIITFARLSQPMKTVQIQ